MIRPYSQVLAVLICLHSVYTQCVDKQPPNCKLTGVPVENYDEEQVFEQLETSVISATTNVTVYSGQIAVFQLVLNSSVVTDIEPIVYINGCIKATLCSVPVVDDNKKTVTRTCTFNTIDVLEADKATLIIKIVFEMFSPKILGGAKLCHQPPSFLTILGPPLSNVSVDYSIDPSNGVTLTIDPSSIDASINISYNLYDDQLLLHTSTFINNIVTIPTNSFHNHTGIYRITIIPSNPAGNGPSTNITINLTKTNYSLQFIIYDAIIFTDANSNFYMNITIKVNNNSLLTVPNYLYLTTSCSNQEEVEHIVNTTYLINHHSNLIFINLELLPRQRNCDLTIKDESGNIRIVSTNQSTYFTTSHELVVQPNGYINITITFIEGATMVEAFKGCLIITTCNTCNEHDKETIFPVTDYYINLGPFMPGEYSIFIYDYHNGQYHSSDPPVITDTFSIPSTTISNTAAIASQSPTPTIDNEGNDTSQTHVILIGFLIPLVIIVIIIIILIIIAVLKHIKKGQKKLIPSDGNCKTADSINDDKGQVHYINYEIQAEQTAIPAGVPSSNTKSSATNVFLHLPAPVKKDPGIHKSIFHDATATEPPSHPKTLSNTVLSDNQERTETDENVIPQKTITQQPPLKLDTIEESTTGIHDSKAAQDETEEQECSTIVVIDEITTSQTTGGSDKPLLPSQ